MIRKQQNTSRFSIFATGMTVVLFSALVYFVPSPLEAFVEQSESPVKAEVVGADNQDTEKSQSFNHNRSRLLSYVLRRQVDHHYSGKSIDDELSQAAFQLYLKQLDSQKRLLLRSEVDQLLYFEKRIDNEINTGKIVLPLFGAQLFDESVPRAEKIVQKIMSEPFDFNKEETYETDPDKLDFCKTESELQERWRKELKYRSINRYLNLMEDAGYESLSAVPADKVLEMEQEAREKVLKSHLDYFSRIKKETQQEHYDRYLNSFARSFDPHTSYMAPRTKEDFDIGMRGSLEGIGATLREEDGYIKVVKIIPGSAADRQGELHADDVILAVAQADAEPVEITDMRLRDAVSLIRGKKGSEVRLTIRRAGHKPMVVPIVRDVVVIEESFVKSTTISEPDSDQRFGYIRLPSFYRDFEQTRNGGGGRNSTDDVKKAIEDFKNEKISGLILDLRNNGGGALTDAVGVTGLFIETGPVVQVRTSGGYTKVLADDDTSVAYRGPMVVLVNQFSASASEIVAGALQDYGRAVIVGSEHTHGKGTVQVIVDLDQSMTLKNMKQYMPLGALKLTTQKFYRISGDSTQYRGVVPDIVLPDRRQYNKFGERYLDHSLPWDAIEAAKYDQWRPSPADYTRLNRLSQQRVADNEDFEEIRSLAEVLNERMQNTRQSLNIAAVYKEMNDIQSVDSPHHGMSEDAEGGKDEDDDAELSETEKLIKGLLEDPYALEVMAVLQDMQPETGAVARGTRVLHGN
jgi:carboxyl-terminal processing protease